MDYTLAKELKDAGYPQKDGTHTFEDGALRAGWSPTDNSAYVPSLEELIDACPKDLPRGDTFTLGSGKGGQSWTATYFDFRNNRITSEEVFIQSAATPIEAVARLWLALNKK